MRSLTTLSAAALVLGSCQAPAPTSSQIEACRAETAQETEQIHLELQSLRASLDEARAARLVAVTGSQGDRRLEDTLVALTARVRDLGTSVDLQALASATEASATREGEATTATNELPTIDALRAALQTLKGQRAVLCENIAAATVPGARRRIPRVSSFTSGDDAPRLPVFAGTRFSPLQGVLELTGNQLDLAIEGRGHFGIVAPNGDLSYTRDGQFRQDMSGRLVTDFGHLLADQVEIPPDCEGISVASDGQVFALQPGNYLTAIGTIRLHTFSNPGGLKIDRHGRFCPTVFSGAAKTTQPGVKGAGTLRQGYIERSNIDQGKELIDLQLVDEQISAIRHALATRGIVAR